MPISYGGQWSTGNVRSLVDYTLKATSLLSSLLGGVHAVIIIIIIIIITYFYNALNDDLSIIS